MRSANKLIAFIVLLLVIAVFMLGREMGSKKVKTTIVNNTSMIKEIAELAALNVQGFSTIKVTNKESSGSMYGDLKNALAEKTIHITVPYEAKYGVDMSHQLLNIDTRAGTVKIYLPAVKLLSFQLKLDQVDALSKTGFFYTASIEDYVQVQQSLYKATLQNLQENEANKKLAEDHIAFILKKYYEPLNLKVTCVFETAKAPLP
ncbi:MAG: hypothetical protein ABS68_12540 [Niastella sp. SCN 39-18]|nr:DUF4230 domain-containing protein [Sphingobacteriales bacterium]ODT51622.1 MAG: hypothetical protein ABS68_12540 [Niastella sp. SCN 39-18]OJW08290.1 MAG: hypothetical protein BGO53_05530 [Sphingobacteriales bacterium 39-19]